MIGAITQALARIVPARLRAVPAINPAGEGNYHPGPYVMRNGILPASWGQYLNFWQMDLDPLPFGENAIVEACVWAYVRALAQLPGYHRRETSDGGGIDTITTSSLSRLLRIPNTYQTRSDFLTHVVRALLFDGNSYSLAVRNARSEVVELHWLNPRQCSVTEIAIQGQETKEVFYSVGDNPLLNFEDFLNFRGYVVPARDILHIKLATPRHPLKGETWLMALALDLANRSAMSASLNRFLTNASRPSGVINTDMTLTKAQVDDLRERWNEQARGMNQGGVPILSHGLKWQPMGISAQDSQLVEALKLTDKTIVGVFGVPGVLVGVQDGAPFASTEALMNWWLANGLGYLLDHIEVAIDQFIELPANEWTEYDTDALLRANTAERIDALVKGVQGGVYAPNEARAREGLRSVEFGDEPRVQQQVVPLSFAGKIPPVPPTPPTPPAPAGPPSPGAASRNVGGAGDAPAMTRQHYERLLWPDAA